MNGEGMQRAAKVGGWGEMQEEAWQKDLMEAAPTNDREYSRERRGRETGPLIMMAELVRNRDWPTCGPGVGWQGRHTSPSSWAWQNAW